MLEYRVSARRVDSHGSEAMAKDATVVLDTDVNGRPDAFNPAELLLAAVAACMIKGIERVAPMLKFEFRGVEVQLHGRRQDKPPKMVEITYELIVDTDEFDQEARPSARKCPQVRHDFEHDCAGDETRRAYPTPLGNVMRKVTLDAELGLRATYLRSIASLIMLAPTDATIVT